MKRAPFLLAVAALAAAGAVAVPARVRACQYCRMALDDPEMAKFITHPRDGRDGGSALDAAISQFQPAPVSGDLKSAPAADRVVTSAGALTVPGTADANGAPVAAVHRPVLAPPPVAVAASARIAKTGQPALQTVPPASRVSARGNVSASTGASAANPGAAAVAHWTDLCLLGLVAVGGVFCWRTRRPHSENR